MPTDRRWVWWIGRGIVALVRPLLCRLAVEGRENVPMNSGAVIASNHNYGPDFVLLAFASPRAVRFMAKAEAFTWHPLLSASLHAGGVFPVQRGKGDSAAIDTAVQLADEGNLIAMFPEGTRSKSGVLMRGKTGAARIALAAGVRQEWLGSFREDRYPVGLHLGARFLLGDRVAARLEYRYDRFLGDPVADFDEQRLVFGLSLLLRNRCQP